jgi:hypothetical protein
MRRPVASGSLLRAASRVLRSIESLALLLCSAQRAASQRSSVPYVHPIGG